MAFAELGTRAPGPGAGAIPRIKLIVESYLTHAISPFFSKARLSSAILRVSATTRIILNTVRTEAQDP